MGDMAAGGRIQLSSLAFALDVPLIAPYIGDEEIRAVTAVLRSGLLAQGAEVAAFEAEFAREHAIAHALAHNSGTAAVHAALAAIGVGPGDEVLATPFSFAASATPILMQGATPRFIDVDPRTFEMDARAASIAANASTAAVVAVDLFGLPLDFSAYDELRRRGVVIIEDACQAIGAERDGRHAGTLGDLGAFSFYATKNVTTGEGGMVVTADDAWAAAIRRFRHHGQDARYEYVSLGFNYRMTEIAAAIGRVQLQRLTELTEGRRKNAAFYFAELGDIAGLTVPLVPAGVKHAFHQFSVLIDGALTPSGADRDRVRDLLSEAHVSTGVYYPKPLHLQPVFGKLGYGPGDFPVAERLARQVVALPIHSHLTRAQLEHVVRSLRRALGAGDRA